LWLIIPFYGWHFFYGIPLPRTTTYLNPPQQPPIYNQKLFHPTKNLPKGQPNLPEKTQMNKNYQAKSIPYHPKVAEVR
jgi:hypothetical protein